MDDSSRIDWLAANPARLQDVYWRLQNDGMGGTLREAIDYVIERIEANKKVKQ
jgi:hypothetical protein